MYETPISTFSPAIGNNFFKDLRYFISQRRNEFNSFGKFTTELLKVPINLRETLKKKHSQNPEYSKILNDPPSLPFIIDSELIYESEFESDTALEVKEIKKIILKYYPKIELTNLSKSLQKSRFIECKPHPTKKNTNVYRKI